MGVSVSSTLAQRAGLHGPLMDVKRIVAAQSQQDLDELRWNGAGLRLIMLTGRPGYDPN